MEGNADWSREKVLRLIELYRSLPLLWDPGDPDYRRRRLKNQAWRDIAFELECAPSQLTRKIHSLRSQFMRENKKRLLDAAYSPTWFAFKHLLFTVGGGEEKDVAGGSFCINVKYEKDDDDCDDTDITVDDEAVDYDDDCNYDEDDDDESRAFAPTATGSVLEGSKPKQRTSNVLTIASRNAKRPREPDDDFYIAKSARKETRDEFSVFGEYVANELRKVPTERARTIVRHVVNNALFDAHMGKFDKPETVLQKTPVVNNA